MAGRIICLGALAWAAMSVPLIGRVGESQQQLEGHLLADGSAQRLSPTDLAALNGGGSRHSSSHGSTASLRIGGGGLDIIYGIDDLFWQSAGQSAPAPDSSGVPKRPPDFPEYDYFKTDDGSPAVKKMGNPASATGWELYVYDYKQVSVLEIYHRLGASLEDAEVEALLNVNHGSSTWTRNHVDSSRTALLDSDSTDASFIGYDYERVDGLLRAKRVGNDLVFFSVEFDKKLIEMKKSLSKTATGKIPNSAIVSTRGF